MKLTQKRKLALVLSGGGVKAAAFHIGVCLALKEKGFNFAGGTESEVNRSFPEDRKTFKIYVGSSAGAVISSFLAAGYDIDAVIDAFEMGSGLNFHRSSSSRFKLKPLSYKDIFALNSRNFIEVLPNYLRRKSVVRGGFEVFAKNAFNVNGIFTAKGIERYLRRHVLPENQFSALGVRLFIIGTQLNHSRKVVFGDFAETSKVKNIKYASYASISDAVAASASLPPVFAPYGIRNQKGKEIYFFDGEIRDTLSTHVAADHGADLVISSYSIQPYHYTREMGSLHRYGIPLIMNQALYQVVEQKIERHIRHQQDIRAIMKAVDGYFKQENLPDEHREKLLDILTKRVGYQKEVDYLYVHPSPQDYEMFFADHFSLSPNILTNIVKIGFRSAIKILRKHDL